MQRSFSSSYVDDQQRSSTRPPRHLPNDHRVYNDGNDYVSSETDSHYRTYLQRASSTSSFSSTSSAASANYRILPVRYSSVDRILPKLPTVTANERGINVRIRFDRPRHHHHHHHHHRQQRENTEEYEHYRRKHMTTEQQEQYGSCPVLNGKKSRHSTPSNITYIETRSIVRGDSNDQLNDQSRKINTRIRHIPLSTNSLSTRVIREQEE